tara:strand:- start:3475 stop:4482 length:1008 start_codon:yes stop_codon:yes gene_type:complete
MKKLLLLLSLFFVSYFSFSQDHSIQFWNSATNILDNSGNKIGYISVINKNKVQYYNMNDEVVKYEIINVNSGITRRDFLDTKDRYSSINIYNKFGSIVGTRFWNKNTNEYDIFNDDDEKVATYNYVNGKWKYKETINYKTDSGYVNLYKVSNPKITTSSLVTSNTYVPQNSNNTDYNYNSIFFPYNGDEVFYVGVSMRNPNSVSFETAAVPEYKYEIGYFDWNNLYYGIQVSSQQSELIYSTDDGSTLNDQIWALSFGVGLIDSFLYLKTGLGYHTYNYNTTEEFGAFYDIGARFYADLGVKLFLVDLWGINVLPEFTIDIDGNTSYGIGLGFEL